MKFIGKLKHEEIFDWLTNIDIYVQPSYQEGLCRAIVEAMSRGKPIIASNAGGNYELISKACIYPKGDIKEFVNIVNRLIVNPILLKNEANKNYNLSKEFNESSLDTTRNEFYKKFMKS